MDRPPIRCFAAGHVVQAVSVTILAAGVKDVWHIVHRFDRRPTGCELSAALLAGKIGMEHQTVRAHIATLQALGLLKRLRGGGLAATLPDDCVPSSIRPGWQEVARLARLLERHLASVDGHQQARDAAAEPINSTRRSASTDAVDGDLQPPVDDDPPDFDDVGEENGRRASTGDGPGKVPSGEVGEGGELLQLESAPARKAQSEPTHIGAVLEEYRDGIRQRLRARQ